MASSMTPERPTDMDMREAWAWDEAEFCDRMAGDYRGNLLSGWKTRPDHADNAMMQARCLIAAEVWEQMARHLRKPYYVRKENEQYRAIDAALGEQG